MACIGIYIVKKTDIGIFIVFDSAIYLFIEQYVLNSL